MAERSGLIVPLGEWILRTACEAATAWGGIGVSVNVSPVQFQSSDMVEVVRAALSAVNLDPGKLELEITEDMLFEDVAHARSMFTKLKALGVKLAMDDFGTGFSSLSSLRSFPFDIIKIDRQFTADIQGSEGGREIVQAILGLGRALGLSVTAEGVETEEQLSALIADECAEVQGFLLARPMAASKIAELLADAARGRGGAVCARHDAVGRGQGFGCRCAIRRRARRERDVTPISICCRRAHPA